MNTRPDADDLRDEYDVTPEQLHKGVRGTYAARFAEGTNLVPLGPDVAAVFPDAAAVNHALRALVGIVNERSRSAA